MSLSLRYPGEPETLTVRSIRVWRRGDISHPVTGSSGMKEYVKNMIFSLFESDSEISACAMVIAGDLPFVIVRKNGRYWDLENGRPNRVIEVKTEPDQSLSVPFLESPRSDSTAKSPKGDEGQEA